MVRMEIQIVMKPKMVPIIVPISEAVLRLPPLSVIWFEDEVSDTSEDCTAESDVDPMMACELVEIEDGIVIPGGSVLYVLGGVGSNTTSVTKDALTCPDSGCGSTWQSK